MTIARLKSLELHGFKTFASRIEFAFPGMVTCIVGPNGSGKSNIADAIRWVLGEQSYSLLRAKKTEDMIFSGSDQRPRAGMASATIVFDNSDGWLPIDFAEVGITRRAYRDGENEYLINQQRVRLKDVGELLAQSGLAERTYTIIGQGLVDAALSLKAEERRRLFEEAAGIGLHRARREESLRRLDITKRNLERAQDILAELQPRLRSLERQARRAQEYEQVKNDLHVLLREWYGFHWHRAQRELLEGQESNRQRDAILERARYTQIELSQRLDVSRVQIQSLREKLNSWHRQLAGLHEQREQLGREIVVSDERIRSLTEGGQNTRDELGRLLEEIQYHQERLETAGQELAGLQSEASEASEQAKAAGEALQARQEERLQVEGILQVARQSLSTVTARQAHLGARLGERKALIERQQSQFLAAQKALQAAEQEQSLVEKRLEAASGRLVSIQEQRQKAEEALQAQQAQVEAVEAIRRQTLEQRGSLQAEVARHQAQLDVLEQAERSLVGYASGARLLLQAVQERRLQGAGGALSSGIQVSDEMETAVAAALGEYLDAVIFLESGRLEDALRLLEGEAARAALLPLDAIQADHSSRFNLASFPARGAVIGLAADLVSVPEKLRPVVDLLLGCTLVVGDRRSARGVLEALRQNPTAGVRVVTMRGEVFYTSGPILAGREEKPGTLSRPRQRRELQEKLASQSEELAAVEARLMALDERLVGLNSGVQDAVHMTQEAIRLEKIVASEVDQEELALEKARRVVQWQAEQHSLVEQEITRETQEMTSMTDELARLEVEINQKREELRIRGVALAALPLDDLQVQLSHWTTRQAVAEQAMISMQAGLAERMTALERSRGTKDVLEARLKEIGQSLEAANQVKEAAAQQEKQVAGEIEALLTSIRPAESELESLEKEYNNLQARDNEARQSLSLAEHQSAQTRIVLARRQEALENLRRRIEDDFGLVAFSYAESISGPTPLPIDGLVEQLPLVVDVPPELEESIKRQRAQLRRMGPINPEAQAEYEQVKERHDFLVEQMADLTQAESDIREVIAELNLLMEREFRKTFDAVAYEFRHIFSRLFDGGSARLVLTDPEDLTETGIDIEARLPGRREQGLSLLSGGERSLTATSLVFALLKVSPTPFCLLDEVDAMLDEMNVSRFRDLLRELSGNTQFVVVTHNRNTVQVADVIYGVTMGLDSTSQVVSLKLDEVGQVV